MPIVELNAATLADLSTLADLIAGKLDTLAERLQQVDDKLHDRNLMLLENMKRDGELHGSRKQLLQEMMGGAGESSAGVGEDSAAAGNDSEPVPLSYRDLPPTPFGLDAEGALFVSWHPIGVDLTVTTNIVGYNYHYGAADPTGSDPRVFPYSEAERHKGEHLRISSSVRWISGRTAEGAATEWRAVPKASA